MGAVFGDRRRELEPSAGGLVASPAMVFYVFL
jgi:hypothetical protein